MAQKLKSSPIKELFYEARAELSKDALAIQLKDEKAVDLPIVCLLCRITTHLRAIEVLYEHELAIEADTILRSCLESLFWMGALANVPDTVEKMVSEFEYQRYSMRNRILSADPSSMKLDDETSKKIELAQAENTPSKKDLISIFQAAQRANLEALYVTYASLSNASAHPSVHSLNRHVALKEDGSISYFTVIVTDPDWDATFHLEQISI